LSKEGTIAYLLCFWTRGPDKDLKCSRDSAVFGKRVDTDHARGMVTCWEG
jgi:hypothetical protein